MKKNVKNNVTRIVLSVLILALIPVMHLLATERPMSYEEYFSQERELIKTPVTAVREDWVGEPFVVTDATIHFWTEQYPKQATQILAGNVYQEREDNGNKTLFLLAEGPYKGRSL